MTTSPAEPVSAAADEAPATEAPATPDAAIPAAATADPAAAPAASETPAPAAVAAEAPPTEAPAAPAAAASDAAAEKSTDIVPGPGGVMTNEVGVVTGELTLRSELKGEKLTIRVQYKEADEWYVVTGGKATLKDPADLEAVHKIVVGILNRPEG